MVLCLKIWEKYQDVARLIKFMKVASSLKSLKKEGPRLEVGQEEGKLYVINKKKPKFKARQG